MISLKSIFSIARRGQLCFIIVMTLLVVSQPAWSIQDTQKNIEVQDETTQEDEVFFLESPTIATPAVSTQIHHVFYEIMVIEYDSDSEEKGYLEQIDDESYKRILLQRVISPNAP